MGKHPMMESSLLMQTEPSTRVFESTMEPVRTALFLLEDALPRRAREDSAPIDALLDVIDARFADVETKLTGEVERLKTFAKNHGCEPPKRYVHAEEPIAVLGYSPSFFRYLDLVLKLDEAMRWLDGLWMARVVPTKDRGETIVRCRNLLLHLSRELQNIKDRAIVHVGRIEIDRGKKMAAKERTRTVKAAASELRRQERRKVHGRGETATAQSANANPASTPAVADVVHTDVSTASVVEATPVQIKPARTRAAASDVKAPAAELAPAEAALVG